MATEKPSLSDRMYAALLRILPFDFRAEFESEMGQVFREQRAATSQERGIMKLLQLWWETIVGIVGMAPREHISVLRQDTAYALRLMRKDPAYTIAVICILGLGIGVNTAVFSVVNSVLLRPLPYIEGNRIVTVRQQAAKAGLTTCGFLSRRLMTIAGKIEHCPVWWSTTACPLPSSGREKRRGFARVSCRRDSSICSG